MASADAAAAAEMASTRAALARARCPLLPERWTDSAPYVPLLERIAHRGAGMVAFDAGRVVGYLAAWPAEGRGERWTYAPEWAWSSLADGSAGERLLQDLYAAAAERWVADGRRTHYLAVFAGDPGEAAFRWLGFGRSTMDGLRDLTPVPLRGGSGVEVRRAAIGDAPTIAELEDGLRAHLASSPVFFALGPPRSREEHERRLADPAVGTLLAETGGSAIGYLRIGPASDDAATVIRDPLTASITGAYTRPDRRRDGVATALLAAAVDWARERGHVRVAVDFETANLLASRFWSREFTPITFSLCRRI